MSGVENEKENRKQQQRSLKKSKNGSIKKSVSGTKQNKSAKIKLKKKASQDKETNIQSSEQRSEQCTLDVSETVDDKDDRTTSLRKSIRKTISNKTVAQIVAPEPPPTHYLPIVVQLEASLFDNFKNLIVFNRNLVITKVARSLMPLFMPGDQVTIVDGVAFWTRESLKEYARGTLARGKRFVAITVIRVWNMSCLTKPQLDELVPPPEDRLHYFSVKLYCQNESSGLMLCADKKRVLVQHVRARTPASSAFLVGDQIIGVNNEVFNPVKEKPVSIKKRIKKLVEESAMRNGYAEILVCRLIGARSSPAPSLEAELAEKFAGYAVGVEKGITAEKRRMDPSCLPLESDVLEIALRELTIWKCYEGRVGFETPICDKGPCLLTYPSDGPDNPATVPPDGQPSGPSTPSSSGTQLSVMAPPPIKTPSCTTMEKQDASAVTPVANTPRKRGSIFKKTKNTGEPDTPGSAISFKEPEVAKITSDVPEEDEVRKCDPHSGMVAYIKHIFK